MLPKKEEGLCGIYPLVNHKLQQLALGNLSRVEASVFDQFAAAHLSSWLQRHGSHLQELALAGNHHLIALLEEPECFASLTQLVCLRVCIEGEASDGG